MPKGFKINPKTGKSITKPTVYTEEYVTNEIDNIMTQLLENTDIYLLGEILETKPYYMQRFFEWKHDFPNSTKISESLKKIKSILELRLNKKGLEGDLNPTLTIFNLKNNYAWKDVHESNVNVKDVTRIKIAHSQADND